MKLVLQGSTDNDTIEIHESIDICDGILLSVQKNGMEEFWEEIPVQVLIDFLLGEGGASLEDYIQSLEV